MAKAEKGPDPLRGFLWLDDTPQWHPGIYEGISEAQATSQVGTASHARCLGFDVPGDQSIKIIPLPVAKQEDDQVEDQRNG